MKSQTGYVKLALLGWLTLLMVSQEGLVHGQTPQEIARKAFGSVVLLVMQDSNSQPTSLGSGFFVRKGIVATNVHVVGTASGGYAKLVGKGAKFGVEGIVGIDQERDLVLLKVGDVESAYLSLGNSDNVEVGQQVFAVGNPQGLEGTFSQGIISGIRQVGADKLLQITAPISPGSSGGPVLNAGGDVIGVAAATFTNAQNLNFAIPSNYVKHLAGNLQPVTSLAKAKVEKKKEVTCRLFWNT